MKSNYKKLAPYIRLVDIRNTSDERYDLLGVSVDKHFIKSIANTIGTDWRTYKVIQKGQFCYIPDTSRRGDKMGIALLTDYDIALVSQAYTVFEIINQEQLLPEYLNLWFKRPEFDRYARFHSHGSVREIFDWEEMCNVELPIPEIEEQRKIVEAYKTIEKRIALKRKINDNLESIAHTLFNSWFVDFEPFEHTKDDDGNPELPLGWEYSTLESCIDFLNGYAFKSEDLIDEEIPDSYDVFKMGHIKKGGGLNYSGTKSWIPRSDCKELNRFVLQYGDILMCMTDMKENIALLGHTAFMDIEDKYIVNQRVGLLRPNNHKNVSPYFLYLLTNNAKFLRELRKNAHIGVQVNLSKEDIVNSRIVLAPSEVNEQFASKVKPLFDTIFKNNAEIRILEKLAVSIQTQLSR